MQLNLLPFAVVWGVLAILVVVLVVYRKAVARGEDDTLHVMQAGAVSHQSSVAHKLDQIDRWGKTLTALVILYGLALAAVYLYQTFNQSGVVLG